MAEENVVAVTRIDPACCVATADNPRGDVDVKSPAFLELVASVKADGIRVPLQARRRVAAQKPGASAGAVYEILDGARRLKAAQAAGIQVPVLVHENLSDEEAFKIVVAANFAREDLTPLQQGRAVEILLAKHQGDFKAVAAAMGQSEKWVALRSHLSKLTPKWLKAAAEDFREYGVGHLELISRLPASVQDAMLGQDYSLRPRSDWPVARLDKHINESFLHVLSKAPWNLDDAKLAKKAPACLDCGKRSSQQGRLFQGTDEAEASADRCLDSTCWQAKKFAWLKQRRAELEKEAGAKLPPTFTEHAGYHSHQSTVKAFGGKVESLDYYDKVVAKKPEKGKATPVFAVDGPHAGEVVYVVREKSTLTGSGDRKSKPGEVAAANKSEREEIAGEFASAACALALARHYGEGDTEADDVIERCIIHRLAEPCGHGSKAFDWLLNQLGLTKTVKASWGGEYEDLLPPPEFPESVKLIAPAALAVFLCEQENGGAVFGLNHDGTVAAKAKGVLPMPQRRPEVRKAAAAAFTITEGFLSKHCAANVQTIAKELGVPTKNRKVDQVQAILDAKLPAGTMTKALAEAFGVPYVAPAGPAGKVVCKDASTCLKSDFCAHGKPHEPSNHCNGTVYECFDYREEKDATITSVFTRCTDA